MQEGSAVCDSDSKVSVAAVLDLVPNNWKRTSNINVDNLNKCCSQPNTSESLLIFFLIVTLVHQSELN